jgi:hypothetical protein
MIADMGSKNIKGKHGKSLSLLVMAGITLVFATSPIAEAASRPEITVTNTITIKRGEKWKPEFWFGNQDEPLPPADYRPDDKHRVSKWYYRNPTHNLNFYVIGLSDKTFRRAGRYPAEVFNPKGGWNWTVCKYKWWRLPFISFQKKSFCFYLGWRERGNFGAKLSFKGGN